MTKAGKGTVQIGASNGRLRLVWSHRGKRYTHYIGLPDSKVGRTVAKLKAAIIEGDLATGNFDPTLNKYKSDDRRTDMFTVGELLDAFIKHKAGALAPNTLLKYNVTAGHLREYFGEKLARDVDEPMAIKFKDWLLTKQRPITVQDRLSITKSCWKWAITQKMLTDNPWTEAARRLKVPPKQTAKPFTKAECKAILEAFRQHKHFYLYADYVEFSMLTGMRTGEVIGLQWRHLSDDCSSVWVGESLVRGVRKATKTGKARHIRLEGRVKEIVLQRKALGFTPEGLVFPSPKGKAINDNNFCKQVWKKVLEISNVLYRKPYTTRSTLISHWLQAGENPVVVAQTTGHDVATLYRAYAGSISGTPSPPNFLE